MQPYCTHLRPHVHFLSSLATLSYCSPSYLRAIDHRDKVKQDGQEEGWRGKCEVPANNTTDHNTTASLPLSSSLSSSSSLTSSYTANDAANKFEQFVKDSAIFIGEQPLFKTDIDVSDLFIDVLRKVDVESADSTTTTTTTIPSVELAATAHALCKEWNCKSCRHFLRKAGSVVVISSEGKISSPIWSRPYPILHDGDTQEESSVSDDRNLSSNGDEDVTKIKTNESNIHVYDLPYVRAIKELNEAMMKAKITGLFATSKEAVGVPDTQPFSHLHLTLKKKNKSLIIDNATSSRQAQVFEYSRQMLDMIASFNGDEMYKSTLVELIKVLHDNEGQFIRPISHGKWALGVIEEFNRLDDNRNNQSNYIWRKATLSPFGYPNWGSSLLNSALKVALKYEEWEDEEWEEEEVEEKKNGEGVEGKNESEVQANILRAVRYLQRELGPLRYQRERRQITQNHLINAERALKARGAESALQRRAITIEDIQEFVCRPPSHFTPVERGDGEKRQESAHQLTTNDELKDIAKDVALTSIEVDSFLNEVLPKAQNMWLSVDPKGSSENLSVFSCAVDPTSVPLLNWDINDPKDRFNIKTRNTVNQGCYVGDRDFSKEHYVDGFNYVAGITIHPGRWHGRKSVQPDTRVLLVDGYKEHGMNGFLFKSTINNRFRTIAGLIEACSRKTPLQGAISSTAKNEGKPDSENDAWTSESKWDSDRNKEIWKKQLKGYLLSGSMEQGTSLLVQLKEPGRGALSMYDMKLMILEAKKLKSCQDFNLQIRFPRFF